MTAHDGSDSGPGDFEAPEAPHTGPGLVHGMMSNIKWREGWSDGWAKGYHDGLRDVAEAQKVGTAEVPPRPLTFEDLKIGDEFMFIDVDRDTLYVKVGENHYEFARSAGWPFSEKEPRRPVKLVVTLGNPDDLTD